MLEQADNNPPWTPLVALACWRTVTVGTLAVLLACGAADGTGSSESGPAVSSLEFTTPVPGSATAGDQRDITVRARSGVGALVVGAEVSAIVQAGGGSITPAVAVTGPEGTAQFVWRMGDLGGAQEAQFRAVSGAGSVSARVMAVVARTLAIDFGPEQFATIPEGSFDMGSDAGNTDERPVRRVTLLRSFQLQRTEVTQAQWRAVMTAGPSGTTGCDRCPAEQLSWDDIFAFIRELNRQTGQTYRLPTEAEWEYAARAQTSGETHGPLNEVAWFSANSNARAQLVAQKQPNNFGLYDMLGNVAEWVQDWYSSTYYATGPSVDPRGPSQGANRVLRGGSWFNAGFDVRAARRRGITPSSRIAGSGFRLAKGP
jgi:formylglycine-generating enzyme